MKFQTHCGYTDIFLILDIILTRNPIMMFNSILKSFCNKCKFFFCKKFLEYEKFSFFFKYRTIDPIFATVFSLWFFKATVFKISIVYGFKYYTYATLNMPSYIMCREKRVV